MSPIFTSSLRRIAYTLLGVELIDSLTFGLDEQEVDGRKIKGFGYYETIG